MTLVYIMMNFQIKKIFFLFFLSLLNFEFISAQSTNVIEQPLQTIMTQTEGLIGINILLQPIDDSSTSSSSVALLQANRSEKVAIRKKRAKLVQESVSAILGEFVRRGQVADTASLWMANMINCKATPEAILSGQVSHKVLY